MVALLEQAPLSDTDSDSDCQAVTRSGAGLHGSRRARGGGLPPMTVASLPRKAGPEGPGGPHDGCSAAGLAAAPMGQKKKKRVKRRGGARAPLAPSGLGSDTGTATGTELATSTETDTSSSSGEPVYAGHLRPGLGSTSGRHAHSQDLEHLHEPGLYQCICCSKQVKMHLREVSKEKEMLH
eukprot:gene8452-7734_t